MTMTVFLARITASTLVFLIFGTKEGSASLLENNCGTTTNIRPKIIGGEVAEIYSNPWMVLVIGEKNCGGSLITSRFVLTAAHCLFNSPMYVPEILFLHRFSKFSFCRKVRLGEYDTQNSGEDCTPTGNCIPGALEIDVDEKLMHKDFEYFTADIALLRMKNKVQFSENIRPICLLVNKQMENITQFNITGWGETHVGGISSRILQTATQNKLDHRLCKRKFGEQVDKTQICAGSPTSDSCGGDSGGPMSAVIDYQGTLRHTQFGIISYGSWSCKGIGVYTNISYYMGWISSVIQNYTVQG
ncbi:venom protease-like [Drosophila subpulchrella]|uniref:venom protease-like n=1 Tax=Drosophila subpulchrella TaxID=1486046 RepID=UPI0018A188FD|nr:venom protease-like [Drosophila subpulchrella]